MEILHRYGSMPSRREEQIFRTYVLGGSGRGYRGSTCCRFSFAVVLVVAGRVASAATPLISGPLVSPKMSASILSSQVRSLFYGGTDS
jgi:hypothetical protein